MKRLPTPQRMSCGADTRSGRTTASCLMRESSKVGLERIVNRGLERGGTPGWMTDVARAVEKRGELGVCLRVGYTMRYREMKRRNEWER